MNEAETRAEHIDPALAAAGWGQVDGSRILREHNITAGRLAIRHTYATNGQGIYGIDMHTGAEAEMARHPTPDELWDMAFGQALNEREAQAAAWRHRFAAVPLEDKGGTWTGRYYQETAINRVLEAVAQGKDRALLTLATGTGKTFIAFQLAWKLFHSRWNLKDWKATNENPLIPSFYVQLHLKTHHAANRSASGERRAMRSKVLAAPEGSRRPCSHSCSVRTETPSNCAKADWETPTFILASVAAVTATMVTRPSPRLACLTDSRRSFSNSFRSAPAAALLLAMVHSSNARINTSIATRLFPAA